MVEQLGRTLVHFLWQGVLIACVYAIVRRYVHGCNARYALGCAAMAAMILAPIVTFVASMPTDTIADNPFTGRVPIVSGAAVAMPFVTSSALPENSVMPGLVLAWLIGVAALWVRLAGGWVVAGRMKRTPAHAASVQWRRILDELRVQLRIAQPVQLMVSAAAQVPVVIGWLRPVVLVPAGALTGLPAEYIEAFLAHELAHVRRHDYLVNILQSMTEALLFYHPAVWWISSHIRREREHCCDDMAITVTRDAIAYASALAALETQRPARLHPAMAANGGVLRERIARVLGVPPGSPRTSGAALLATAAALIACTAILTPAQSFEVASIKLSPPEYVGVQSYVRGDRYTAMTATLRDLISFAYHLQSFQITGGPAWASSITYNVSAKMGADAKPDQSMPMVQALLADRFGLKFHRVTKNFPGYFLAIDKSGPKLKESPNPGPGLAAGNKGNLFGRGADTGTLAKVLSERLGSPIADRTGLKAFYNFTLTWTPEEAQAESPGATLFTALRDQLGLRLQAVRKVPVEILVIDRAEKPNAD